MHSEPPLPGGLGERERRWLIVFLALASAYVGLLLAERLLEVLGGFSQIMLILFLAWLLAFVMAPLVGNLQQGARIPRPLATVFIYFVTLVILGFVLFYTGSAITQEVGGLADDYRLEEEDRILQMIRGWTPFGVSVDFAALYADAAEYVGDAIGSSILETAQSIAGVTLTTLGSLLLIVILSLYMVMDSARILGRVKRLVPKRYQDEADLLERSAARAFGGFLRAQLILAALQGLLVAIVGMAFGVEGLFLAGALSALAMLVPFFGPPLALIPPIAITFVFTPSAFIPVTIILVVVQTVAVNWLQPRLMQGALGLHPILVLVGLLLGAQVAGVWGALFGIPVIAVIYVFVSYMLFRAVPNVALPDTERLDHVREHTLVSVEKGQLADETHPHIHVTRTRREDGSEEVHLDFGDESPPGRPDERDAPA